MAVSVQNSAPVYANLVRNHAMSLAQVPEDIRREVEALVISDVPFDINGEASNAASSPIVEYKNLHEFPNIGIGNRLYVDLENNCLYRWDSVTYTYVLVSSNISQISIIDGGDSNV